MKPIKKALLVLFAGFFAFAPPGTLIFLAILAASFFGRWWVAAACAASLVAALAYLVFRKRLRTNRASPEQPDQSSKL